MSLDCLVIGSTYDTNIGTNYDEDFKQTSHQEFTSFFFPQLLSEVAEIVSSITNAGYRCGYMLTVDKQKEHLLDLLKQGINTVFIPLPYIKSMWDYKKLIQLIHQHSDANVVIGGRFIKNIFKKLTEAEQRRVLHFINADCIINRYECQDEILRYLNITVRQKSPSYLTKVPNITFKTSTCYVTTQEDYTSSKLHDQPIDWLPFQDDICSIAACRTTINCDFACAFCAIKDKNEKFEMISLQTLQSNLTALNQFSKVKTIYFTDETVNYPIDRFRSLLSMMIDSRFTFNWFSFCRVQFINDEIACLMKRSGCIAVLLGLESGNDELLKRMNKDVTARQLKKGIEALHRAGIITIGLFVVGYPGETDRTMQETVNFIDDVKPTFHIINPWTCEVNTQVWNDRLQYGLKYNGGLWIHDTMNYKQANDHSLRMAREVRHSTNLRGIDISYIIQLLNAGHSLEDIQALLHKISAQYPFEITYSNQL